MRALLALVVLGWATTASAEPPPLPPPLEGTVVNGEFQPGDLGWLRGRFADATEADKARLAEVKGWLTECFKQATAKAKDDVRALGEPTDKLPYDLYGEPICAAVALYTGFTLPEEMTFDDFNTAATEVRPILAAWVAGSRLGAAAVLPDDDPNPLLKAVAVDQALRYGFTWEQSGGPQLPGQLMAVLRLHLALALNQVDRANTALLKTYVADRGWPTSQAAGEPVSHAAWLLAQHADFDPAWQVRVLRLLEPLVSKGQASGHDLAYLTDRVRLKLTGQQVYGTQFTCTDGELVPDPIKDESGLDRRRAAAGLPPWVENLKSVRAGSSCGQASQ